MGKELEKLKTEIESNLLGRIPLFYTKLTEIRHEEMTDEARFSMGRREIEVFDYQSNKYRIPYKTYVKPTSKTLQLD